MVYDLSKFEKFLRINQQNVKENNFFSPVG
jgi:hypothetical protein